MTFVEKKLEVDNFQKLISDLEVGEQNLTQLLHKMKELSNGFITEEGLRIEWLKQLPMHMRLVLSINKESSLDTLAAMVDQMAEYSETLQAVATVSTPAASDITLRQLDMLSKQLENYHYISTSIHLHLIVK